MRQGKQLIRARSMPDLEGTSRWQGDQDCDRDCVLAEKEKGRLLECAPDEISVCASVWSVYSKWMGLGGNNFWDLHYEDVVVSPWCVTDTHRLVRRLQYTVDTDMPIGPPKSVIVEMQETDHRGGAGCLFERWSIVVPRARWGIRFHIHIHIRCYRKPGGHVIIEQRTRPVILKAVWGLSNIVKHEVSRQCRAGFDKWRAWMEETADDSCSAATTAG